MKLRNVKYYFRESFKGFTRNRVMSLASVISVTATLIVIGIFLIMALNVDFMAKNLESQVEVKAYLIEGLQDTTIEYMKEQIIKMDGVKDVVYTSKEKALADWKETLGEDSEIMDGLENRNPLPASFSVILVSPEYAKPVAKAISTFSGVEKAEYGREVLDKLLQITSGLRMGCLVLIIVLFLISTFIIANTIKLTVYARRREISIMKYVGATDWFVRWPFIIEGILIGLIGGLVTTGLLAVAYYYVLQLVNNANLGVMALELVPFMELLTDITGIVLLLGVVIGFLGSLISVRKFLKV